MSQTDFNSHDFDEVGLPEGTVYPGYWWVQWGGLQDRCFIVKHLHFRLLPGARSAVGQWLLDGLTDDPGGDFICGAASGPEGTSPSLSFLPDHRGRAHTVHTDSHGEGTVTLTALGENLMQVLTGSRLEIDGKSEWEAVRSVNAFLDHAGPFELDEVRFELEAQIGAFKDTVWSIGLQMVTPETSATILDLDGVTNIHRRAPRVPHVQQHLLDMAEFEGYREFGPMDSSAIHELHLRSLAAAVEAINTPIALDADFLSLLVEPGEDHLLSESEIPRALYVAALMVVGANRAGVGRQRAEDWPEANELARWIVGIHNRSGLIEQRDMIELVFGAVASLSTAEQAEALFDAELFVAGYAEKIEERYRGLARELKYLRLDLLWRVRRDELVGYFQKLVEDEEERFQVIAEVSGSTTPVVFRVDLSDSMKVQAGPRMYIERPELVEKQHEHEYWLRWTPDLGENTMSINLDHPLVQNPDVVAGIITHAIKTSKRMTPEGFSWKTLVH